MKYCGVKVVCCCVMMALLLPMLLTGCTAESAFSAAYEILEVNAEYGTVKIRVTLTNEGGALTYTGAIADCFSSAVLTDSAGNSYKAEKTTVSPDATNQTMKRGEQATHTYTFAGVSGDGTYSLRLRFMSQELEIPDISVAFS